MKPGIARRYNEAAERMELHRRIARHDPPVGYVGVDYFHGVVRVTAVEGQRVVIVDQHGEPHVEVRKHWLGLASPRLVDLVGAELSEALARALAAGRPPAHRAGLTLVCLLNSHLGANRLLCDHLPADARIPHRYEGEYSRPPPELAPEPRRCEPVWTEPVVLEQFGRCVAVY